MMIEKKNHLQKLMDKQRKKSEMYVHTVQKANKYKADNYHDMSIYNNMAFELHKKEVAKKDKL